jgi:peptidoglycan/LPS O-acetylase OafA/YrhL
MSEFFAEFGTYLIKYGVFLFLAITGFVVGAKLRKAKDSKEEDKK